MWSIVAFTVFEQALLGSVIFWMPSWESKGRFFGRRTGSELGKEITLSQWRWSVATITLVSILGSATGGWIAIDYADAYDHAGMTLWIGSSILHPIGLALAWLILHRKHHPTEPAPVNMNRRQAYIRREPDPAKTLKRFLLFAPLLCIVVSMAYLALRWDHIPERYPVHWNIRGEVDAWNSPTLGTFVRIPLFAMAVWSTFLILLKLNMFDYMPPRRKLGFELLILAVVWAIVPALCLTYILLPFVGHETPGVLILLHVLSPMVVVVVFLPIWLRVSARLPEDPPPTPAEIDRDDYRYWRWGGLFYCNPDDPAQWVEKRLGVGATPNMAHFQGKAIAAVSIVILVASVGWLILCVIR